VWYNGWFESLRSRKHLLSFPEVGLAKREIIDERILRQMNLNGVSSSGFFWLGLVYHLLLFRTFKSRTVARFATPDLVVLGRIWNCGVRPGEEPLKVKDQPENMGSDESSTLNIGTQSCISFFSFNWSYAEISTNRIGHVTISALSDWLKFQHSVNRIESSSDQQKTNVTSHLRCFPLRCLANYPKKSFLLQHLSQSINWLRNIKVSFLKTREAIVVRTGKQCC